MRAIADVLANFLGLSVMLLGVALGCVSHDAPQPREKWTLRVETRYGIAKRPLSEMPLPPLMQRGTP